MDLISCMEDSGIEHCSILPVMAWHWFKDWVVFEPLVTKDKPTVIVSAQQMSVMNAVFSVCADRIGEERGCVFIGNSCITDPRGGFVAGPGDPDKAEVVMAEINLMLARYRHWSEFNNPLTDRRTDLYYEFLGYYPAEEW